MIASWIHQLRLHACANLFAVVVAVFLSTSCAMEASDIDALTIPLFKKSLFSPLKHVSVKQVHLEQSKLQGETLLLSGYVLEVGEHNTYFVLSQGMRRLLVLQVDITNYRHRVHVGHLGHLVNVMGELKSAKKGLPSLYASVVDVKRSKDTPTYASHRSKISPDQSY
ncbi:MAG: hypothetical protein OXC44_02650 [Proteobacteria bacterium]|nr:hypothetical protein [Pseudomonadota bacterium]